MLEEATMTGDRGIGDQGTAEQGPQVQCTGPDAELMARVIDALKAIYDPEIPVDIWELGLVYRVDINAEGDVAVEMTLTAPSCPVAGEMPGRVQEMVAATEGVRSCTVDLVWEPPWHQGLMSEVARVQLDMF